MTKVQAASEMRASIAREIKNVVSSCMSCPFLVLRNAKSPHPMTRMRAVQE
jgi:hypothetical protein